MHGDKSQEERDWVIKEFKQGKSSLLIATDVAARGLDIDDIRMVVNFDMPKEMDSYVHRIGRTGRAGKTGTAVTFFNSKTNGKIAGKLVQLLKRTDQNIPPELASINSFGGGGGFSSYSRGGGGGRR